VSIIVTVGDSMYHCWKLVFCNWCDLSLIDTSVYFLR